MDKQRTTQQHINKTSINKLCTIIFSSVLMTACMSVSPESREHLKANHVQQTEITTLDHTTILKTAYPRTQTEAIAYVEPNDLDPYFKTLSAHQLTPDVLGFIHPTITYNNPQGELRYLIIVEKVQINNGYISSCRACQNTADFLIYKHEAGQYQLVNSALDQTQVPSANGHLQYQYASDLQKNLQPFGKNMMGSYVLSSYSGAGGDESSIWFAVHLPDEGKVQAVEIGAAGRDTSSFYADRPALATSIYSTLKLIDNQSTYYPIEVIYYHSDQSTSSPLQRTQFIYDQQKQGYVEHSTR
ncbi:hypothetical protein SAMN05421749_10987 [Acinetobacter marinus]|uniref:Lipoprotein n=2 Tax=Acinetobacter marinus TaxID=281375 RepID=A0A1G6NFX1_9GAMM|nr:hypothetical protein SAMN05421749_10987 [Acinetobacter marinus]